MNPKIDDLIVALKAFALANTVAITNPNGSPGTRPMTELEALGIAAVRLAKRYTAQGVGLAERDVAAAMLNRLNDRVYAWDKAKISAEASVVTSNQAAVLAILNAANLPE